MNYLKKRLFVCLLFLSQLLLYSFSETIQCAATSDTAPRIELTNDEAKQLGETLKWIHFKGPTVTEKKHNKKSDLKTWTKFAKITSEEDAFKKLNSILISKDMSPSENGFFIKKFDIFHVGSTLKKEDKEKLIAEIENEINIHQLLSSRDKEEAFVVPLYFSFKVNCSFCDSYYMIMPLQKSALIEAEGDNVSVLFKDLDVKKTSQQILRIVQFLHQNRIVHRDIKLENILIDHNDNVRICDFGFSMNLSGISSEELFDCNDCGSPDYISPEFLLILLKNHKATENMLRRCDLWSAAVMIYTLHEAQLPFLITEIMIQNHEMTAEDLNELFTTFMIDEKKARQNLKRFFQEKIEMENITSDHPAMDLVLDIFYTSATKSIAEDYFASHGYFISSEKAASMDVPREKRNKQEKCLCLIL